MREKSLLGLRGSDEGGAHEKSYILLLRFKFPGA